MADAIDFEKYDGLDAKAAAEFLEGIEDAEVLSAFIAHEQENKGRSTVLTDDLFAQLKELEDAEADADADEGSDGEDGDSSEGQEDGQDQSDEAQEDTDLESPEEEPEEVEPDPEVDEEEQAQLSEAEEQRQVSIEALLYERKGYEMYGTPDQVEGVNAELEKLGYDGD